MIEWVAPDQLVVGGRSFEIIDARPAGSASGATAIRKSPWCVQRYLELADTLSPRRVVEIGIDQGGSTVFFALVLDQLEQLLALDLGPVPDGLARFVADHERGRLVRCEGGVDQADADRVTGLVDSTFGSSLLDLVIDDASHLLAPTRASFDRLFPRLRAGGVFVIEDWSWEHRVGRVIADRLAAGEVELPADADDGPPRAMPLSRLLLECVIAAGHAPEVVADVRIRQGWSEIVRGPAALDADFALAAHLGWTGEGVLGQRFDTT